jgi:hypothetical protein
MFLSLMIPRRPTHKSNQSKWSPAQEHGRRWIPELTGKQQLGITEPRIADLWAPCRIRLHHGFEGSSRKPLVELCSCPLVNTNVNTTGRSRHDRGGGGSATGSGGGGDGEQRLEEVEALRMLRSCRQEGRAGLELCRGRPELRQPPRHG